MSTVTESTMTLTAPDGTTLFVRRWAPEQPVASMVVVHGASEHSGHYQHVAAYFAERGLACHVLDLRGHGHSSGTRVHVDRFDQYIDDLHLLIQRAREYGKPLLVGHSMGGLVAFHYAARHQSELAGLVLSSPWFGLKVAVPALKRAVGRIASTILPRLSMPSEIRLAHVSRDPETVRLKEQDPLFGRTFTPRWGMECESAATRASELAPALAIPTLVMHAGDDLLTSPDASRSLFDRIGAQHKEYKLWPGKYHEIFNDPGYEEVFESIINWLKQQELVI